MPEVNFHRLDRRVLVAEPIYDHMPREIYFNRIAFWQEIYRARLADEYDARPSVIGPMGIRYARDSAIRQSIQYDATHLLMIDNDIRVQYDVITHLLLLNQPIAAAVVNREDGAPTCFIEVGHRDENGLVISDGETNWLNHPKDEPFRCAAVGAAVMMIRIDVLHKMVLQSRWVFNYDDSERTMDDLFCRKARALGYEVWCTPVPRCTQIPRR